MPAYALQRPGRAPDVPLCTALALMILHMNVMPWYREITFREIQNEFLR
jgi:hypothetical protein